LIIDIRDLETQ